MISSPGIDSFGTSLNSSNRPGDLVGRRVEAEIAAIDNVILRLRATTIRTLWLRFQLSPTIFGALVRRRPSFPHSRVRPNGMPTDASAGDLTLVVTQDGVASNTTKLIVGH